MAGYTVDVEELGVLGEALRRFVTESQHKLIDVEHLIATVSASWDGVAAAAYEERHRQWADALREMTAALHEFESWATDAEEAYRTVMAMNMRMAGQ